MPSIPCKRAAEIDYFVEVRHEELVGGFVPKRVRDESRFAAVSNNRPIREVGVKALL